MKEIAASYDVVQGAVESKPDGNRIKMALEVVENSWEGSVSSDAPLGNGTAVSPCDVISGSRR